MIIRFTIENWQGYKLYKRETKHYIRYKLAKTDKEANHSMKIKFKEVRIRDNNDAYGKCIESKCKFYTIKKITA